MKGRGAYSRKVSSEEAREGYLLILKNRLQFFPPLGKTFELVQNDIVGKAKVESYRCKCRGPELPHEHYFIRWKGLRPKDIVEIQEDPERQSRYVIQIRR